MDGMRKCSGSRPEKVDLDREIQRLLDGHN